MILAINLVCLGIILGYPKLGAFLCAIITCIIAMDRIRNWKP